MDSFRWSRLSDVINDIKYDALNHISLRSEEPVRFQIVNRDALINFLGSAIIRHEVVPSNHPVRLFFDIDIYTSRNRIWEYIRAILNDLKKSLIPELSKLEHICQIPLEINIEKWRILISLPEKKRISNTQGLLERFGFEDEQVRAGIHVILPMIVFEKIKEMKTFVSELMFSLEYSEVYDLSVYRKNCSFRVLGSLKSHEEGRPLRTISNEEAIKNDLLEFKEPENFDISEFYLHPSPETLVISLPNRSSSQYIRSEIERRNVYLNDPVEIYNYLIEKKVIEDLFVPNLNKNNIIHLRRTKGGFCGLCQRVHDSENAWLAVWALKKFFYIVFGCYRTSQTQTEQLPDHLVGFTESLEQATALDMDILEADPMTEEAFEIEYEPVSFSDEIKEWKDSVDSYDIQKTQNVEIDHLPANSHVFVVSGMGTAKTVGVHKYLKKLYTENSELKVILVSARRTLSAKFFSDYSDLDFELYWDIKGPITAKRIIVQVESLSRIDLENFYDIIILDEIITLFQQFIGDKNSSLSALRNQGLHSLISMMINANIVISLDAYFSAPVFATIQSFAQKKTHLIVNIFPSHEHYNYNLSHSIDEILAHMINEINSLKENEQIFIACESRGLATSLHQFLFSMFPEVSFMLLTSQTEQAKKFEYFTNVDLHLCDQVVIFTSVVSSGISYTKPVKRIYGFSTGRILHARALVQMLGRARNCKNWIIFIPEPKKDSPSEDWETIFKHTYLRLINRPMFIYFNALGGKISLQSFKSTYLALCLLMSAFFYQSQTQLLTEMKYILSRYGGTIEMLEPTIIDSKIYTPDYKKIIREMRKETRDQEILLMIEHAQLDFNFDFLIEKNKNGEALSLNERNFISAHMLIRFFNYCGPMDLLFFKKYDSKLLKLRWLKLSYSLNNPINDQKYSKKEERQILILLESLENKSALSTQINLMQGDLSKEKKSTARKLMLALGFENYWNNTGMSRDLIDEHLTEHRLFLHQQIIKLLPNQMKKIYTIEKLWVVINRAIRQTLGFQISKKEKNLKITLDDSFSYVAYNKEIKEKLEWIKFTPTSVAKKIPKPIIVIGNSLSF